MSEVFNERPSVYQDGHEPEVGASFDAQMARRWCVNCGLETFDLEDGCCDRCAHGPSESEKVRMMAAIADARTRAEWWRKYDSHSAFEWEQKAKAIERELAPWLPEVVATPDEEA